MNNRIKKLLKSGKSVTGPFITVNAPDFVEAAALCGFDFGVMDMEHGPFSVESAAGLIRAAEFRGMTPLVRVPDSGDSTILKALDTGAHGIIVPQVNDRAMAERIVRACHYHPVGKRGLGLARAYDYGSMDVAEYFAMVRDELLVIVQCETREGLENLEEIARTPWIDVIFLGPFDLSQSLGFPGETDHPEIRKAAEKIVKVCAGAGKSSGVFTVNGEQAKRRREEGFGFIALGTDISLFSSGVKRELAAFRG